MIYSYYPTRKDVEALHAFVMEGFDRQPETLNEPGKLESALGRARNAALYEDADLATQAVRLLIGIAQAHSFTDGNKRTAEIVADTFIQNNDHWVACHPIELAYQLLCAVRHTTTEEEFAEWIRTRLVPLDQRDPAITERITYSFIIELTDSEWGTEPRTELGGLTAAEMRAQYLATVEKSWDTPVTFQSDDLAAPDLVRIFIFNEEIPGRFECRAIGRSMAP